METILNRQRYQSQSYATRVWVITIIVLTLCLLGATVANAAAPSKPVVVVSQVSVVGDLSKDAFNAGMMPSGGSFAVTANGYIVVGTAWGSEINIFNVANPGPPTAFAVSNISGVTSDQQNNLFLGALYKHKFYKMPYLGNGTWDTTLNLDGAPNCTGTDTVACGMTANIGTDYNSNIDFKNFVFDAAGNLFLVSATLNNEGGNAIYKLAAADLYTGKPTLVFADDATHAIASIAVDPWGNLFFTDVVYADQGNQNATISSVNVLPYSASTGFASSKTVLATFTNPSPGNYDNVLSGVGVDPTNGTVYFSDNNGTYAFPNTPSYHADIAQAYLVTATGGYQVTPDSKGSLYSVAWDNAGGKRGVFQILLNNVMVPSSAVGTASEATNVTAALNGVDCTGTVTFARAGGNVTAASADASGSTCSARSLAGVSGATYGTVISLTPAAAGTSVAAMTATDSAGNSGAFTITGGTLVGRRPIVTTQVSVVGDLSKDAFNAGMMPSGGSFAVTANGYIAVGTAWGSELDIFNIASPGAPAAFSVSNISGVTSDKQNNLFLGALYKHKFYKLPHLGSGTWDTTLNLDAAPNCTGTDTVACGMTANIGTDYNSNIDFKNFVFDAAGNLFLVSATDGSHGGNAIYKLAAADLYTGTPTLVFTDDATHAIASIAVDPWGNLFFTDVVYADQGNQNATVSSVNVLPYSASAGFAPSKTVLATFTNPSPGNYDNVLSGVGVDTNGTVYYSDNGQTFAIANNPVTPADGRYAYLASAIGGYQVTPDSAGNLYSVAWDNAGGKRGVFQALMNNVVVPAAKIGGPSQATDVTTSLSGVDCSGTVSFAFASGNASTTASAATTGSCSSKSLGDVSGVVWPTTVTLVPSAIGPNTAVLTATDSASNTGTVTVFGNGLAAGSTAQTITFADPGAQSAAIPLTLVATASSNLPVLFTSITPGVCTVTGNVATFLGAGTCTIMATQSGDDTYAAAPPITHSLTVSLTVQTITFANPGAQNISTSLVLPASASSGLPVTLASTTPNTCTLQDTTASFIGAGTCTIEASQAGNNLYAAAATVTQSFEVKPPNEQTITFANPGTQMVGYPLQLSATATSGLPVSFASTTPTICTIANTTATFKAAGNCTIVASQAGNNNYAPAPAVTHTFPVIVVVAQTITFDNPGAQRVGTPLTLSATATSGLAVTFATTTSAVCTVTGTTATFVTAGTCTIVASQPGDLATVGPAPTVTQSFTVNPASWAPFSLTPSASEVVMTGDASDAVILRVTPGTGFIGKVNFACSGLPQGTVCNFYPATITLPNETWTMLTISKTTSATAGTGPIHSKSGPLFSLVTFAMMGCCLLGSEKRRAKMLALLAVIVISVMMLSSCGTGSKATQTTVTVTATSGAVQQSTTVTLTVR